MATTYGTTAEIDSRQTSNAGFARRIWDRFVDARQREANRRVLSHLRQLDIDNLRQLGYTSEQICLITGDAARKR